MAVWLLMTGLRRGCTGQSRLVERLPGNHWSVPNTHLPFFPSPKGALAAHTAEQKKAYSVPHS